MTDTATWPATPLGDEPGALPGRSAASPRIAIRRPCVLAPVREPLPAPAPGEFMMMYAFGIGEVAISVSGVPDASDALDHAHDARGRRGQPSAARCPTRNAVIGMRGPFGTSWGLADARWPRPRDRRGRCGAGPAAARWCSAALADRDRLRPGDADRRCALPRRFPVSARNSTTGCGTAPSTCI